MVISADRRRSGPSHTHTSCVLPKGVSSGQMECGGIVLAAICWIPSAQRRCHPKEALYLPTFSHLLIVNKLLSLSLSLSLTHTHTHTHHPLPPGPHLPLPLSHHSSNCASSDNSRALNVVRNAAVSLVSLSPSPPHTPPPVFLHFAASLAQLGWTLRCGGPSLEGRAWLSYATIMRDAPKAP